MSNLGTTTLSTSLQYSSQHKIVETSLGTIVVFANMGNGAGNRLKYKVSTDNGITFGSWIVVYDDADVTHFDCLIDENNDILIILYATGIGGKYVRLIYDSILKTWSIGDIKVAPVSAVHSAFCKRNNGDLWIASGAYGAHVFYASYSADDGDSWTAINKSVPYTSRGADILAIGEDIWAFTIQYSGSYYALYVFKYTTSWDSGTIIGDVGADIAVDNSPSAIKIEDNNIWVNAYTPSGIKVFNYTTSWDAGELISDNVNDGDASLCKVHDFPVVVWKDYDGSNYNIVYKHRRDGGVWSSPIAITSDSNTNVTPSVVVSSTHYIYVEYITGTGSPYDINFYSSVLFGGTTQLQPEFQWIVSEATALEPEFQWRIKEAIKLCPNLINFDFTWSKPVVIESIKPASTYGCLFAYSLYLSNTGSAGNTIVEIYLNTALKKTITIAADDYEHKEEYYFGLADVIDADDEIKVKVTSVATDAENLKVNIYQMSFPFKLEPLFVGNLQGSILFRGDSGKSIFNTSDYWVIEFNQPIQSVDFVSGTTIGGEEVGLSGTIINGSFKDSRIRLPIYNGATLNSLIIKVISITGEAYTKEIEVAHFPNFSNLPDYASSDLEIAAYISPEYFKYSFDNIVWSSWAAVVTNIINISFSGQVDGAKTLYLNYRCGNLEITETKNLTYKSTTTPIDSSVDFTSEGAMLNYSDDTPLEKVQILEDGVLIEEVLPLTFTGFDSVTKDATDSTIEISSGTVYYGGEKYDYTPEPFDVAPSLDDGFTLMAIFCFNYSTKSFEWKILFSDLLGNYPTYPEGYFVLYKTTYWISYYTTPTDKAVIFSDLVEEYSNPEVIPLDMEKLGSEDKTITLRVTDVAGRTTDYTKDVVNIVYDLWRTVTVTDDDSNEIESGEIHSNTYLNFTIEIEEKE